MPLMTFWHKKQEQLNKKWENLNNSIYNIINVYEMYKHKIPDR